MNRDINYIAVARIIIEISIIYYSSLLLLTIVKNVLIGDAANDYGPSIDVFADIVSHLISIGTASRLIKNLDNKIAGFIAPVLSISPIIFTSIILFVISLSDLIITMVGSGAPAVFIEMYMDFNAAPLAVMRMLSAQFIGTVFAYIYISRILRKNTG